jgi:cytochrome P450
MHIVANLREAPGPRGFPLLGSLPDFAWGDPTRALLDAFREYGDVVRFRFGPVAFFGVNHPDHIRHVLQENRHNYTKSVNYEELRHVLGNGLLTSEGDSWLRQRRLAQPAFHRPRLAALASVITRETSSMLDRWSAHVGATIDVSHEFMRVTLGIVGHSLFGVDLASDADSVGRAVSVALEWANARMVQLVRVPARVPTVANVRARLAIRTLDALVYRIIESRRHAIARNDEPAHDLLAMLIEARDEKTGEGMSDVQLRDEVMTLVLAGHETTANALTWTAYLLSRHPAVERKLREEISSTIGDRTPTFDDLPKLSYTMMVIEESLRLYPPAWCVERQAIADDDVGGFAIPHGSIVLVAPYTMHRHPSYWDDPEGFDPERFAPSQTSTRPKFAYIPFGGGPRVCIGNHFALMEMQLVLAMIVQRYRLDLVSGHRVEIEPLVTLRPRYGMKMSVSRAVRDATRAADLSASPANP